MPDDIEHGEMSEITGIRPVMSERNFVRNDRIDFVLSFLYKEKS